MRLIYITLTLFILAVSGCSDNSTDKSTAADKDKHGTLFKEPIKALGVYNVAIKLHADVRPEIKVWVIKEE